MWQISRVLAVLAAAGMVLAAQPASANWYIQNLTNHSGQEVTLLIPINEGQTKARANISMGGNIAIQIPGRGIVKFKDTRHRPAPCGPYWSVAITYNAQQWTMYYDGDGLVDVTLNADGSVTLRGVNGAQIVDGDRGPVC